MHPLSTAATARHVGRTSPRALGSLTVRLLSAASPDRQLDHKGPLPASPWRSPVCGHKD